MNEVYFMSGVVLGFGIMFMLLAIITSNIMYKKAMIDLEIVKVQKEIELIKRRNLIRVKNDSKNL